MIYFDNAATTKNKPASVYEAYNYYMREIGVSPGRGSYQLGINASRMLYEARYKIGVFFGLEKPENVVFTKNSTEAINLFFKLFLKKGDHVVISCYEHNAVLRPLHQLKMQGIIDYSIIDRDDMLLSPAEIYNIYAKDNTKLISMTLASNVTGRIVFREDLYYYFKKKGITTFVDSSQGAGKLDLSMKNQYIDYVAFTGHKDLLAMPGVGGLCCSEKLNGVPLIQGGTGIYGDEYNSPQIFPEGYEAGTYNMPAIWSLHASIDYLMKNKKSICEKEETLINYLIGELSEIKRVQVYDLNFHRVATCCFNVIDVKSNEIVRLLDKNGVCVRGGVHCAILAHQAIGTENIGAIRASINCCNNEEEINEFINIIKGNE